MTTTTHTCDICLQPVAAEYDPETQGEWFPSHHFECWCPVAQGGAYQVAEGYSYTHLRAAIMHANLLADANTPFNGWRCTVTDVATGAVVFTTPEMPLHPSVIARRAREAAAL